MSTGGLGVIGGVGYTPEQLSGMIAELKVGPDKTIVSLCQTLTVYYSRSCITKILRLA